MSHRVEQRRLQTFALFKSFGLAGSLERVLKLVVQALDFGLCSFGFFGPALHASGQLPDSYRRYHEGNEGNPVMRISNGKRAKRRQEEKIERYDADDGSDYGRTRAPRGGHKQNDQKEGQRDSSWINVLAKEL